MNTSTNTARYFIGLMSGTSLDGVDGVIADFEGSRCNVIHDAFVPFPAEIASELLALNSSGEREIERSHIAANQLAKLYATCVEELLTKSELPRDAIRAIGCHGQTIRHRPDLEFTVQIGNSALLAELTGSTVVADFRSRDLAAGGQGAPLVPAFHLGVFGSTSDHRAIVNIGGISNISDLSPSGVKGFDCGPGNLLMNGWVERNLGLPYDKGGAWASRGKVIPELLVALLEHPFFKLQPPKSTGRDEFHLAWLEQFPFIQQHPAEDVQATLLELTAVTIADAILHHCNAAQAVFLCGGGAYNQALVARLKTLLAPREIAMTDALGIPANLVEAAAFAWLAQQALTGKPGNLPAVTGARGPRILGAIYPA